MLVNFYEYVLNFGSLIFTMIQNLANNVFTITENIVSADLGTLFSRLFNGEWVSGYNVFGAVLADLGLGNYIDPGNFFNTIGTIVNTIFIVIVSLFNTIIGTLGLSIPVNNPLLVVVYIAVLIGTFIFPFTIVSRLFRKTKDIVNPLN